MAITGANLIERLVPGNALKAIARGHSLFASGAIAFGRNSAQRIQHSIRRVNSAQILRHLGAKKSPSYRVRRVALDSHGPVICDRNEDAAGVGTIVRTSGMDNFRHDVIIRRRKLLPADVKFIEVGPQRAPSNWEMDMTRSPIAVLATKLI